MKEDVRKRLRDLNRDFYNTFAGAFSDSRAESEPGFERIVARMTPGSRVLDLGCGQARLAQLLPANCDYVGVDFSVGMIREAKEALLDKQHGNVCRALPIPNNTHLHFVQADLVDDPWHNQVGTGFDRIVLRAVLHHIPGYASRRQVIERALKLLAPRGQLVLANWQFLQVERLRRRIVPWSKIDLTSDDVEPGDYLLDWRRQGHGLRYVHLVNEEETLRLARETGLRIAAQFRADGHTNDLTLYAVLERPHPIE